MLHLLWINDIYFDDELRSKLLSMTTESEVRLVCSWSAECVEAHADFYGLSRSRVGNIIL